MGASRRQFLFNQIIAADPTKNTEDTLNGDIEEQYYRMVNAGTIKIPAGVLSAKDFGAIGDGVSRPLSNSFSSLSAAQAVYPAALALSDEQDWAAIQSCIKATGGAYLPKPSTNYVINRTIDISGPNGGWLIGAFGKSRVVMTASNLPILQTGNSNAAAGGSAWVSDVSLEYSAQQTSAQTNSNGIQMLNVSSGSYFRNISIKYASRSIYNDPSGYVYSTTFEELVLEFYSICALSLTNSGGITGNVLKNIYTHNNSGGSNQPCTQKPVQLSGWDEGTIIQLNVEWTQSPGAIDINNCKNLVFNSIHFEGITYTNDYGGLITLENANDKCIINNLSIINCSFTTANVPAGLAAIFKLLGNTRVIVNGLEARSNTSTIANARVVYAVNQTSPSQSFLEINHATLDVFNSAQSGDSTQFPVLKKLNETDNWQQVGNARILPGSAAPTTGTWGVGDTILNTTPTASGNVGWICVTAGTPGTWKTYGAIGA